MQCAYTYSQKVQFITAERCATLHIIRWFRSTDAHEICMCTGGVGGVAIFKLCLLNSVHVHGVSGGGGGSENQFYQIHWKKIGLAADVLSTYFMDFLFQKKKVKFSEHIYPHFLSTFWLKKKKKVKFSQGRFIHKPHCFSFRIFFGECGFCVSRIKLKFSLCAPPCCFSLMIADTELKVCERYLHPR